MDFMFGSVVLKMAEEVDLYLSFLVKTFGLGLALLRKAASQLYWVEAP